MHQKDLLCAMTQFGSGKWWKGAGGKGCIVFYSCWASLGHMWKGCLFLLNTDKPVAVQPFGTLEGNIFCNAPFLDHALKFITADRLC